MSNNTFFELEELGQGITLIRDLSMVQMYLVEGKTRSVLIDTGTGVGNLKSVIEQCTSLPVTVLNTHGHLDHAGGNFNFDEVYISMLDIDLFRNISKKDREDYTKLVVSTNGRRISFGTDDFLERKDISCHPLKDGDKFDLGNRVITAVSVPGHTAGSIGFIDSLTKSFFSGDCCNASTFLFFKESTTITAYRSSLVTLSKIMDDINLYYVCHDYVSFPKSCVKDLIVCCDNALSGQTFGAPFIFDFMPDTYRNIKWAFPVDKNKRRVDGGYGNLVFDPGRI